jgi:hypothetical protein
MEKTIIYEKLSASKLSKKIIRKSISRIIKIRSKFKFIKKLSKLI